MIESKIAGYPITLPEHRHAFHTERPDWHKAWLDSIHESLKPDDVVIDVGAEQGDLSALVASWVPRGSISLVEPVAGFWPTIRETFEMNDLAPPVVSFVGFAATESSNGRTSYMLGWPLESAGSVNNDPGFQHLNERRDLQRMRLDDWSQVDGILIDVEGAELQVLRGAESTLTNHRPLVWCAIHPEIMYDRYGHDPNELLDYMYRLGYRWDFLGFQGELHFKFSPR